MSRGASRSPRTVSANSRQFAYVSTPAAIDNETGSHLRGPRSATTRHPERSVTKLRFLQRPRRTCSASVLDRRHVQISIGLNICVCICRSDRSAWSIDGRIIDVKRGVGKSRHGVLLPYRFREFSPCILDLSCAHAIDYGEDFSL
jgi:hypothetical protein